MTSAEKKSILEFHDPPGSVEEKLLALSMALAATAGEVTEKIGLDPMSVMIKLTVGDDSISFRLQLAERIDG